MAVEVRKTEGRRLFEQADCLVITDTAEPAKDMLAVPGYFGDLPTEDGNVNYLTPEEIRLVSEYWLEQRVKARGGWLWPKDTTVVVYPVPDASPLGTRVVRVMDLRGGTAECFTENADTLHLGMPAFDYFKVHPQKRQPKAGEVWHVTYEANRGRTVQKALIVTDSVSADLKFSTFEGYSFPVDSEDISDLKILLEADGSIADPAE